MSAKKGKRVGVFVLVIGVVAVVGGVMLARNVLTIQGWPTARATVVERGVGAPDQPTGGTRNARFVPKVRYAFEVGGVRHEATGIGPLQEAMTAEEAERAVAAIPDTLEIRYDPDDPTRAYIEVGSLTFPIVVGIFGILLALIGAGMLFGGKDPTG